MNDEQTPTSSVSATRSMLRWYPSRWRSRYGREFAAMVEDDLAGRSPTMRYRLSLARSGLNERLHESGLVGNSAPPEERIRDGSLTVLCAFALFVLPGIGFAKISEHWDQSFHGGARRLSATSFDLLAVVAVVCAASVVIAAIAIVPTAVRFVRIGGWPAIRRRVVWAVTATLATAAVGGGLVGWARHLTTHQRNAGFGWYQFLSVIAAILVAATLATWSAVAVATTRRLHIGMGQLRVDGILAATVAVGMPIMTAAAAVWWGSMAATAPWFLAGTPVGSSPSPLAANLLVVLIVMMVASGAGVFGLIRVIGSWRLLRSA